MANNSNKVTFIGCGRVGMSSAFALLLDGIANQIVLLGRCRDDIVGEQLDLEHGMPFVSQTTVLATENYHDIADSDIVVITAGASQKPGDTRLDLTAKNIEVIESIIPQVVEHAPDAIIVIVSNPVDVLTYHAYRLAGWPKGRIFGSGTVLDTARFRVHLAEFLHVNPTSIHAYILGEHGDSSFAALNQATIGGRPLATFPHFSEDKSQRAFRLAKDAAYHIIQSKGATYYAIAIVILKIIKTVLRDARSILPVSIPLHQYYGLNGVALSVPCIVGRQGVTDAIEIKLSWDEKQLLERSAKVVQEYLP
ncbi:MAG: L-lactate dehydrogenase [Candidatus Pacebacteria bacterium CG10_big_fil_rev_8_21_14_0_10_56_10]|nr:MAG: L-lactate dehydrogenase [Candidatus Pacebacteria bacterium CG10_big_fil_rev_8_21_14_0_10_56_10]